MTQLTVKEKEITLLDILDRILNKGVVLWGDITLSVADVDLVYVGLKVLLTSVETAERMRRCRGEALEPADVNASPPATLNRNDVSVRYNRPI
ncbi:MAG: gas vesicle protein [Chloroflexi bacterium]|nr:gas vesicle protein [Chloroflexota bacterium]